MSECVICYGKLDNTVFVECNNEKCTKNVCWSCFTQYESKCPVCTLYRPLPLRIEISACIQERLKSRWEKLGFTIRIVFAGTANTELLDCLETCPVEFKKDPIKDVLESLENGPHPIAFNLQPPSNHDHNIQVYTRNLKGTAICLRHTESQRSLFVFFL